MADQSTLVPLRDVGPNEHRCVIRQAVGFYRTLVIGGVYIFASSEAGSEFDIEPILVKALKHCVQQHPILSAVIVDSMTEKPKFAKPAQLDLKRHISIAEKPSTDDWAADSKAFFLQTLDTELGDVAERPPWTLFALRDAAAPPSSPRYLLLFGYGHSHGDGKSGLAFQRVLLNGLNLAISSDCPYTADPLCPTTSNPLPPTLEMAGKLSISLSFLLLPALVSRLPQFIVDMFGLRAKYIPEAERAWRGRPEATYDPSNFSTGTEILRISEEVLDTVLRACRRRGGKITGLLHILVARALSEQLPADGTSDIFVSQSAVDLRRAAGGLSEDDMGVCVTGYYEPFPRTTHQDWAGWTEAADFGNSEGKEHPIWASVRKTTDGLAQQASTLHNQPIGLLRYLHDFKGWTLRHVGKQRELSYEVSNLTVFDQDRGREKPAAPWRIESLLFGQPANVMGGCFDVNIVTLKGGDMTIAFTWQKGSTARADEEEFMRGVAGKVGASLKELADAERSKEG